MTTRRSFARLRLLTRPALRLSLPLAALALLAAGISVPEARAEAKVENDTQKAIYLIGVDFAERLQSLHLTDAEIEIIARGLREGHAGTAMELDPQVYGPKLMALQKEREAPMIAAYIEAERKKPGAKETDSGLIFTELEAGEGDSPADGSKVKVHYTGTLRDGSVFDSSTARGTPAEFVVGKVIACWNEALTMMKPGGKARLVCPAKIAYGDNGVPGAIPPGAVLTFDVELLSVE